MSQPEMWAIVLAGQRDGEDELAAHAAASCKAFVEIHGKLMLWRVLEALSSSRRIGPILLSGPDEEKLKRQSEFLQLLQAIGVRWSPPRESPSASTYDSLCRVPPEAPVLVTTADHPLLSAGIIDEFCTRSAGLDADLVVGLAPHSLVRAEFPEMRKTVLRFRGIPLCGCNLFAFMTREGREAADYWRRVESGRKKPLRLIGSLGWWNLARYVLGRLALDDALAALSSELGLRIGAVILQHADAAVDVDSVSDFRLVDARFRQRADDRRPV
ncbi:MAG: nucleotidyltransferase family protein [Gammaproteobacteria bacterium]